MILLIEMELTNANNLTCEKLNRNYNYANINIGVGLFKQTSCKHSPDVEGGPTYVHLHLMKWGIIHKPTVSYA